MLLIIEPVGQRATRTEAEGREAYASMMAFGERLIAAGKLKAVESLAGLDSAVRVTRADGMLRRVREDPTHQESPMSQPTASMCPEMGDNLLMTTAMPGDRSELPPQAADGSTD